MEDFPIDRLRAMFETNTFGPLRLVQQRPAPVADAGEAAWSST